MSRLAAFIRPLRKLNRISLKTLLALVALISIWLGYCSFRVAQQRDAVAAIHACDGIVFYDWHKANGYGPDCSPPAPKWLRKLIGDDYFQSVIDVQLNRSAGRLAQRLACLPKLEILIINDDSFNDEDLRKVATLSQIRTLNIANTNVSDQGLTCLKELPRLESLILSGPHITGSCLKHVADCRRLEELRLWDVEFTIDEMEPFSEMLNLQNLELSCDCVTDDHIKCLTALTGTRLRYLYLYKGGISDVGCRYLENLSRLQQLQLPVESDTTKGIPQKTVRKLQKALPNCEILD